MLRRSLWGSLICPCFSHLTPLSHRRGLVTYRTVLVLYDANATAASVKQQIAYVVCHELAHQVCACGVPAPFDTTRRTPRSNPSPCAKLAPFSFRSGSATWSPWSGGRTSG